MAPFPLTDKAIITILPRRKSDFLSIATHLENTAEISRIFSFLKQVNRIRYCMRESKRSVKKADSIRSLQRAEANLECFAKATDYWNPLQCLFYKDCLQCGDCIRLLLFKEETSCQKSEGIEVVICV